MELMRMSLAVLMIGLSGCAQPSSSAAGTRALPVESPATPSGRVFLSISDPAADEGMFWEVSLAADGSFSVEHTWSDGGASSNVKECVGQRPAEDIATWFTRAEERATLDAPPMRSGEPDFSKLEVTLAYEGEGEGRRFVPLDAYAEELLAWAQVFVQSCS